MFQSSLSFGLRGAILIIVYSVVVWFTLGEPTTYNVQQMQLAEILGYVRYIILALAIVLAMRAYRARNEGIVRSSKVIGQGLLVALSIAIAVGLMEAAYIALHPDFMQKYMEVYRQNMIANGASTEELSRMQQEAQSFAWMQSPAGAGVFYFAETSVLGSIIAAIVGLIMHLRMRSTSISTS